MKLTFTGVDERTDLGSLPRLGEIGVLYTASPDGRNRYPCRRKAMRMLSELALFHQTSLHVCGRRARKQLVEYQIHDLTHVVDRIQVNGFVCPDELRGICELYRNHEIITQDTDLNGDLRGVEIPNHSILVDASGGRGISPVEWQRPSTVKPVGFAGGLGPDNIAEELGKIQAVATGDWWIDMEGKLRDEDDWFDVGRANRVAEIVCEQAAGR